MSRSTDEPSVLRPAAASSSRTALIVGAGIGGLSAAVALKQAGWRVRVFEQSASPRVLGFALMLAPNALGSLRELGLATIVKGGGVVPRRAEFRRPDGRVLRRIDLGEPTTSSRPRALVTLRPALHGALLEAAGPDVVELNCRASGFTVDPSGVTVLFADGGDARGAVLIGADGIGSMIRQVLHPGEPPAQPSGYVAVRGVTRDAAHHLDDVDGLLYLGEGVEAGVSRASATSIYWYMSLLAADVGPERDPRVVLERHSAGFEAPFKAITRASDDLRFDELLERRPLDVWGRGAVTLLGDAAHPMLPHAGQGAAQALEDAIGLSLALGTDRPVDAALRHYERIRGRRTRRIAGLARRIARTTTTRSRVVRSVRDAALRVLPARLLADAFEQAERTDPNRELRRGADAA